MFQPTEFLDGENIVIINDIPYYRYTGVTTYKEKLKNGLSLDYVFYQQDSIPNSIEEFIKEDETNTIGEKCKYSNFEEDTDFYDEKEFNTIKKKDKTLSLKKRQTKNTKKNKIRQSGYTYKLFTIEQELSDLVDLVDNTQNDNSKFNMLLNRLKMGFRTGFSCADLCGCQLCCKVIKAYNNSSKNPCGSIEDICNCDTCKYIEMCEYRCIQKYGCSNNCTEETYYDDGDEYYDDGDEYYDDSEEYYNDDVYDSYIPHGIDD